MGQTSAFLPGHRRDYFPDMFVTLEDSHGCCWHWQIHRKSVTYRSRQSRAAFSFYSAVNMKILCIEDGTTEWHKSGPWVTWEQTISAILKKELFTVLNHPDFRSCLWHQQAVTLSNLYTTASTAVRLFKYLKYQDNDAYILILQNSTKF